MDKSNTGSKEDPPHCQHEVCITKDSSGTETLRLAESFPESVLRALRRCDTLLED